MLPGSPRAAVINGNSKKGSGASFGACLFGRVEGKQLILSFLFPFVEGLCVPSMLHIQYST